MKKVLIVSTLKDHSVLLFKLRGIENLVNISILLYEDSYENVLSFMQNNSFDYIYLRDCFNSPTLDQEYIQINIKNILINKKNAHLVDSINMYSDMLHEDKWIQYKLYKQFMPKTSLIQTIDDFDDVNKVLKKRISCRSRGIVFSKQKVNGVLSEYILQEKKDILKEYRVFYIYGEILDMVAIRSSKKSNSKSVILKIETISDRVRDFSEQIVKKTSFDVLGLDIIETKDGIFLLEVNRSPQFSAYFKYSKLNLAKKIVKGMLKG